MIRIAVCDAEEPFRDSICNYAKKYLKKHNKECSVDIYKTGTDLLAAVENGIGYQIIFLDIGIGKIGGEDIAKKIKEYIGGYFLVVVSAYGGYASEGYKFSAFRYIEKYKNFEAEMEECMEAILKKYADVIQSRTYEFREGIIKASLDKIWYIESDLHFLAYYIMEKELVRYTRQGKLSDIEKELPNEIFIRIHQSYLVNAKYIYAVKRNMVLLENGIELAVSRTRYKEVKEQFIKYGRKLPEF